MLQYFHVSIFAMYVQKFFWRAEKQQQKNRILQWNFSDSDKWHHAALSTTHEDLVFVESELAGSSCVVLGKGIVRIFLRKNWHFQLWPIYVLLALSAVVINEGHYGRLISWIKFKKFNGENTYLIILINKLAIEI